MWCGNFSAEGAEAPAPRMGAVRKCLEEGLKQGWGGVVMMDSTCPHPCAPPAPEDPGPEPWRMPEFSHFQASDLSPMKVPQEIC